VETKGADSAGLQSKALEKRSPEEFKNELKRWLPQDKWKILDTVIKFYES